MTALQTLTQIFTEPGKAMEAVRERSMIALPLLLLVLGNIALMVWYYQSVDFAWLFDHMFASNPDIPPDQIEKMRGFMSRNTMMIFAVVGTLVMIPAFLVLSAVYYLLVGKANGSDLSFGKWFAFSVWSSVPNLLLLPVSALQILMSSNGQLGPESLNPLSFNELLFHYPISSPLAAPLGALHLLTLWSLLVGIVGYQRWTGKSQFASALIVVLPALVIFGGWIAVAALKAGA